jgi:hypothetical protein
MNGERTYQENGFIHFHCEGCGRKIRVPLKYAGKGGKCPDCKAEIIAPYLTNENRQEPLEMEDDGVNPLAYLVSNASDTVIEQQQARLKEDSEYKRSLHSKICGQEEGVKERSLPWLIDIFAYPLNRPGMIMIGMILGIPIVFGLLFSLIGILSGGMVIVRIMYVVLYVLFLFISVIFGLYYCWYLGECIRDSSTGNIRAPETLGSAPGLGEMFFATVKILGCLLLFELPTIAYYFMTSRIDTTYWILLCSGLFFFPMTLLAVIMFDSLTALNPILITGSIFSTLVPYCGVVISFGGMIFLLLVVLPSLLIGRSVTGVGQGGFSLYSLLYFSGIFGFYFLMVFAHVLGRFYWRYQEKLNWDA